MTEGMGPAALVRAYLAALNRGSIDDAVACVGEGFVNEHLSALGKTVVGREAYRARLTAFLAEFPGLQYEVEELIADGGHVAVAYRMTARWRAPGTDAGTGRPFSIRGMFHFVVAVGQIVHRADYWDSADFLRQVADERTDRA
ncbi:MAG: ester cyclase [Gammaproteobacteria bacterium]